jgi:cell division protein FtsL
MIRIFNFLCVALMGLTILALYHVSEATRVAHMRLDRVNRQISDTRSSIGVLEAEWERVAGPARIQALAESKLGMSDTASVQVSSFDLLPRRGEDAPLGDSPLRNANAQAPASAAHSIPISDRSGL